MSKSVEQRLEGDSTIIQAALAAMTEATAGGGHGVSGRS